MSDDELVARVRLGDAAAFEAIYDRYHHPLLGFCRHMLGSQAEAEDALQHVFIAAYRTLRTDERHIRLKSWLYAVAGNRCRSVLRVRREDVSLEAVREPATAGLALADDVERREELKLLLVDVAGSWTARERRGRGGFAGVPDRAEALVGGAEEPSSPPACTYAIANDWQ